jgi:ElaB/YqjD/DUF883 family membrane-anchored ribosome-binding protein
LQAFGSGKNIQQDEQCHRERVNEMETENGPSKQSEQEQRGHIGSDFHERRESEEMLNQAVRQLNHLVHQQPLTFIGGALAFGFILGRIMKGNNS